MLSVDRLTVICDYPKCGRKAVGGCQVGTVFSPGNLISWCDSEDHEEALRDTFEGACVKLSVDQLRYRYADGLYKK